MVATSPPFRRREKKFSKKLQRSLDPAMLLSRGISARFIGANVMQSIATLSKEEIEKDLRHMTAYYQANVAYAQQHYIYLNREEVEHSNNKSSSGHSMIPPIAMPVRIDPEEEKRLQNLRKKIALCETQREFLESQYVSLRAHYVATTKELAQASKTYEGLIGFLQLLTKRRARVLALHRARLQIARELLECLEARSEQLGDTGCNVEDKMDMQTTVPREQDIAWVWAELEEMIRIAELECRKVPCSLTLNEKTKKKSKGEDGSTTGVIPWDAIKLPNTPQGIPLYLSQLSTVPEKGAAFASGGVFGTSKSGMTWLEQCLPVTYNREKGQDKLTQLKEEVAFLEEELAKERKANKEIQIGIIGRRKRSDELVAMQTLFRSETELILQRHNVLLESPQAKQAARELHEQAIRKRTRAAQATDKSYETGGSKTVVENSSKFMSPEKRHSKENEDEDDENDGDDEGDDCDDEEGELKGDLEGGSKRDMEEGFGDSPPTRKRRKV